jgi:tetratricopeptide (TPR) repeat protein
MTREVPQPPTYIRRNMELRAAEYYASIRKPQSQWRTIEDLAPQLAEFEHRVQAEDYDSAYQLVEAIDVNHLLLWGYYTRLIALRTQLLGHIADRRWCANNQGRLGLAYQNQGRYAEASALYKAALSIARETHDRVEECAEIHRLGTVARVTGQIAQALQYYQTSLALALGRESFDVNTFRLEDIVFEDIDSRLGIWISDLGSAYRCLGQMDLAIKAYELALQIDRQIGERRWEVADLLRLGSVYRDQGQFGPAIEYYQATRVLAEAIHYRKGKMIAQGLLGTVYRLRGDLATAIRFHGEALEIATEIGDARGMRYQRLGLAKLMLAQGRSAEAHDYCQAALELDLPEIGDSAALVLGMAYLREDREAAGAIFQEVVTRCCTILNETADLHLPRYILATALVGQAVCDPHWLDPGQRAGLLAPALAEFRRALEIAAAPGVVRDALHDLELIRAAGIEGLEPVFALLEQAIANWQPLPNDALPSSAGL